MRLFQGVPGRGLDPYEALADEVVALLDDA